MAGGMGTWCFAHVLWIVSIVLHHVAGQSVQIEEVRLANGNRTAGRVEVRIGGTFGTVCDDNWGDVDATVVCKQLGLTGGTALRLAAFGQGSGPIHLDDVSCQGDERDLNDCYFSFGDDINCQHSEDAAVVCQPADATVTPAPVPTTTQGGITQPDNCASGSNRQSRVRLFGPESQPGVGYVQIRADNGTYGYVCDDNWDVNAAKVVCNEMCYDTSLTEASMKEEYRVGVGAVTMALDDVSCVGTESTLADCSHAPWFVHDCGPSELAAVTCVIVDYPTPTPPSPLLDCRDGDLIAGFSKSRDPDLEPKHLSLATSCPSFAVDDSDPDYITVNIPFDDCGTLVKQNESHIIYSNTVFVESTSSEGSISRVNEYRVELTCEMPRNATVDRDVKPLTETVTQRSEGKFVIEMHVYQDRRFTQPSPVYPYELTLGDWLNVGVELEAVDSRLKLVVTDCLASPNLTDSSAPTIDLLRDKCVGERVSLEVHPLSQVKMGFRLQSFAFVNYPLVVLQCKAIVCLTSEVTSECDRSCNNSKPASVSGGSGSGGSGTGSGRRRRDVSGSAAAAAPASRTVYTVRSQPVVVVERPLTEPPASPNSTTTTTTTPTTTTSPTSSARSSKTTTTTTTTTAKPSTATQKPATTSTTVTTPSTVSTTTTPTTTLPTTTSPTGSQGAADTTNTTITTTPITSRTPMLITVRGTGKVPSPSTTSVPGGGILVVENSAARLISSSPWWGGRGGGLGVLLFFPLVLWAVLPTLLCPVLPL